MTRGLRYSVNVQGEWSVIRLEGMMHDNAEAVLDQVLASSPKHIIFDFANISAINSTGIADWLEFIDRLAGTRQIIFDNCSPPVVEVINMVSGFYKGATIRSVLLPYSCGSCAHEWFFQLNLQQNDQPGDVPCPKCQAEGTVDVDLEDHLFFREAS